MPEEQIDLVKEVRGLLATHSIVAMRVDKPYKEIRELLKALCDELEGLRAKLNDPCLVAGYHVCGGEHDLSKLREQ